MSIRKKTLLAIGLTSLVLLVVLLSLVQLILLNGFNRLQEESVQRNMLRVRNVIASELDSLSAIVGDWAYWDDTYQYIQDKNQDYLVSNLNDESISNLKLNLFLFIDMNNQLVFGKRFDLKENQILSLPDELLPNGTLLHSEGNC